MKKYPFSPEYADPHPTRTRWNSWLYRLHRQCRPDRIDLIILVLVILLALCAWGWWRTLQFEAAMRETFARMEVLK